MLPYRLPTLFRLALASLLLAALIGLLTLLSSPPSEAQSPAQATGSVTPAITATVQYPVYFPWLAHIAPGFPTDPFLWTDQPLRDTVTLRWRGGTSIYFMQQSSHYDMTEAQTIYRGSSTELTLTLPIGTYYFRVQAVNKWGVTPGNTVAVTVVSPSPTPTPPPPPTATPRPAPQFARSGFWSGTRSSSFTVTSDNKVRALQVTIPFWTSTCTLTGRNDVPIQGNSFVIADPDLGNEVRGHFDSPTTFTGSYSIHICGYGGLVQPSTGTWTSTWQHALAASDVESSVDESSLQPLAEP